MNGKKKKRKDRRGKDKERKKTKGKERKEEILKKMAKTGEQITYERNKTETLIGQNIKDLTEA